MLHGRAWFDCSVRGGEMVQVRAGSSQWSDISECRRKKDISTRNTFS